MPVSRQLFADNVRLLKSRATRYAIYGALIACTAVILGTLLVSYFQFGAVTLEGVITAQKTNVALWLLDAMPFIFALWGQYVSSLMAYEAGAMVVDQTEELRTQTAALEYKVLHDATHDALTDLPNRILLQDRLGRALAAAQRDEQKLSIMLLDLENFKEINATLGHYNGDRLLKQIAVRLNSVVEEPGTLARFGGDVFAVLVPEIENEQEELEELARKIHKALSAPYVLDGFTVEVRAIIGAAVFPDHGRDCDMLLQRAEVAMHAAKKRDSAFRIYAPDLDQHSPERLTLVGELRQAIEFDELLLYYQPKLCTKTNQVRDVEALVRWRHKRHGLIAPEDFIPLAERSGLMKPLSLWVLKDAVRQVGAWAKAHRDLSVAINLSPRIVLDPDFPEMVSGLFAAHGVLPEHVVFEITETGLMINQERALEVVARLTEMGTRISIDDFGTGYSSLSYLARLPVAEIKIDKSFVMCMLESKTDAAIVRATIDLAHNLGLKVVAEGVLDRQTYLKLKSLDCDYAQGYYISQPLSAQELEAWIAKRMPKAGGHAAESTGYGRVAREL